MSRPWSSVPSRKRLPVKALGSPGGVNPSIRFRLPGSNGSCGAIHGARIAATIITRATMAATMATGEWRKLQATSLSQRRARRFIGAVNSSMASASGAIDPKARIDGVVEQVHDQVDDDEDSAMNIR
jgi:hypothetical protein